MEGGEVKMRLYYKGDPTSGYKVKHERTMGAYPYKSSDLIGWKILDGLEWSKNDDNWLLVQAALYGDGVTQEERKAIVNTAYPNSILM
jgi:hypothetical protein